MDEDEVRDRGALAFDRGHDLDGLMRQAMAVVVAGDRTSQLQALQVPALVIHGTADIMCDASGGHATAAAIAGAELVLVPGMGHNLPRGLSPQPTKRIADHVQCAEKGPH